MNAPVGSPEIRRTKTSCPYCGVGCGVVVEGTPDHVVVSGDPDHPANFGRLCSKGAALGETIGLSGRLLHPLKNGKRTTWADATTTIADKFSETIADHGPDSVAFYVSGQILIEDYYVANKLMKGFIGSANIDTNSRLCMASSVAGHKRAFGSDTVPGIYEDLELADLIVLVGSNLAWCHPVLYQRIAASKKARPGMRIVVIDPRETPTCDIADLHLPLAPGSDVALFQGLFNALKLGDVCDRAFVARHTNNVQSVAASAKPYDIFTVSEATGLPIEDISTFYNWFAATEKTVTVYSQGVNQAEDGTDRVNTIINAHLFTGRIGRPGMGPFSVTGQPDAMGGREVGGLANQLACHMELDNPDDRRRVQQFWDSPKIATKPGLMAVDLFDAVYEGHIKAIWIMATNPVVSMPNANKVREALRRCDFVVVSDVMAHTDTSRYADIVLPSTAWGEKNGTVTNSERRMSRQRSFLTAPGEAKDDWRQFCDVAAKMGWARSFSYENGHQIFQEYARLTAFQNDGRRDLDLGGLATLDSIGYNQFPPTLWPVATPDGESRSRFFEDGLFYTKDRRANFVTPAPRLSTRNESAYPLILNTGRNRDQWHTMTRTGISPTLSQHLCEPYVALSPVDATRYAVQEADIARITSPYGLMLSRVHISDRQNPGSVFVPMHWTDQFASNARVDALVAPKTDRVSGQPASKSTAVKIEKADLDWFGFVLFTDDPSADRERWPFEYWALSYSRRGYRLEIAGKGPLDVAREKVTDCFFSNKRAVETSQLIEYDDVAAGHHRAALFVEGVLRALVLLGPKPVSASRSWLTDLSGRRLDPPMRQRLLAGRPGGEIADPGPIVCSCMNVGANTILDAVTAGCKSVEEIGMETKAGTNCGSCVSELRRFVEAKIDA